MPRPCIAGNSLDVEYGLYQKIKACFIFRVAARDSGKEVIMEIFKDGVDIIHLFNKSLLSFLVKGFSK